MKRLLFQTGFSILLLPATAQIKLPSRTELPTVRATYFPADTVRITSFGAKADGWTLNTAAINTAIDACNRKGGGVVLVPAGLWKTGPLVLKSNVNLHLAANAIIQFTTDFSQYALVEGNWEGMPQMRNQSPISATGATNIAITGKGIVDGAGDAWRMVKRDKLSEGQWNALVASGGLVGEDGKTWYPSEKTRRGSLLQNPGAIASWKTPAFYDSIKDFLRPNLLVFANCRQVLLEGVTFQNSPAWCLHPLLCTDVTVRNVYAKNPWYAQNGDGIDIESCSNVLVEGSTFDVGDDGLCIKSGRDEEGRKRGVPTENVVIRNCVVYHAHGGFVIGSEMSGGVRNVWVYDCSFLGTDIGLRFKTTRGRGGVVERVYVSGIDMKDIVGDAILFDMYYAAKDPIPLPGEKRVAPKAETWLVNAGTPVFRDFHIDGVVCDGAARGIFIRGLPEMPIRQIELSNMVLKARKGIVCSEADSILFHHIRLMTEEERPEVYVDNGCNLHFDQLRYNSSAPVVIRVSGDKSQYITVSKEKGDKTEQTIQFSKRAAPEAGQHK